MPTQLTPAQQAAIQSEFSRNGRVKAQALMNSYGYTDPVDDFLTDTHAGSGSPWLTDTGNPAMGLGDKPMATTAVGALTQSASGAQALAGANQSMLTDFVKDLESRINAGDSAGARERYNQAKTTYGLTDADMQPYMKNSAGGYNFTLPQIQAWSTGWDGSLGADGKPLTGAATEGSPVYDDGIFVKATDSSPGVNAPWETGTDQVTSGPSQDAVGATGGPGANTNGQVSSGTQTTSGTNSPGVIGNQNVTGNTANGNGNQFGNNNVSGSYNTDNHSVYNGWGTQGGSSAPTSFNTPMLNALYAQQQQNMTSTAPSFNFQAKPQPLKRGGRVEGALTRVIKGC